MKVGVVAAVAVPVVAALAVVTACGSASPLSRDDQPGGQPPPGWQLINLPNDTRDLYTFCDHGNRVYVTQSVHEAAAAVAAQDPTCKEGQ